MNIDISRNNGQTWSRIAKEIPNGGSYPWPVTTPTSSKCLIRVSDTDKDPWDVSDATFSIVKVMTGAGGIGTGFQLPLGSLEGEEGEADALMAVIGEGEMALPPEDAAPEAYVFRPGTDEPQETDGWIYVRDEEGLPDYEYQIPAGDGVWDESVDYPYDDEPESVPQTQPSDDSGGEPAPGEDGGGGAPPPPATGAEITYYVYSMGGTLLAEYDSDGNCNRNYIYAGSRLVAEYRPKTGETYYYMEDQINSTRVVTNADGADIYSAMHDPYGGLQREWKGLYQPALKFSGKERDRDTQLDYFGARWYAHGQYRWISVDPVMNRDEAIAIPQHWNLYAYCHNNPVTLVDPDGKNPVIPIANLLARIVAHPATQRVLTWASTQGMRAWNAATRLFNTPQGQEAVQTAAELVTGADLGPTSVAPSLVDDVVRSSARAASAQITEGARAIAKKLGHGARGGYKSAFEGLPKTQQAAEQVIKDILTDPNKTVVQLDKYVDVYAANGRGVRILRETNEFVGFVEEQLSK